MLNALFYLSRVQKHARFFFVFPERRSDRSPFIVGRSSSSNRVRLAREFVKSVNRACLGVLAIAEGSAGD